jgi:hypothetical protein
MSISHVRSKPSANGEPQFSRTTFRTSREMDFFTERELVTQTGHGREEWPLVIVKELIDNALDACEETGVAPVIGVIADPCGITVSDNGPGLPEATLCGALDFTVRVSNREAYVSPCRGAQGNALKTLLPMPHILDPEQGKFILTAQGTRHEITCGIDPISQRPVINDDTIPAKSKNLHDDLGEKKQLFPAPKPAWNGRDGAILATTPIYGRSTKNPCPMNGESFPRYSRSSRGSPSSTRTPRLPSTYSARKPSGRQPIRTGPSGNHPSPPRPIGTNSGTLNG